ncbi:MAG: GNAT family N-acetyltransferase [Thermoprotei archaeon]
MNGGKWLRPSSVDESRIISSANLLLPRVGFSARSLKRLIHEDPHYSDDLSGVHVDETGVVDGCYIVSLDKDGLRAWIKLIYAHPSCATELSSSLDELLSSLVEMRIKEVRVSDRAGFHFRAGIEGGQRIERNLLEAKGFRVVRSVADLEVDLSLFDKFRPPRFEKNGFTFGPPDNVEALLGFVEANFGLNWKRETEESLKYGGVIQAKNGVNIAGFADYSGFEETWFGPIGVAEQYRERGIGSELLFAALTRMRERGVCHATIPWTEHLTFYGQTDAIVGVRNLYIMSKKLL